MIQTSSVPMSSTALPAESPTTLSLAEVLEAIDLLSEEDRDELYELTRTRRIEVNRARMWEAAEEARRDYAAGNYRVMTPQQIVDEMFT